MAAIRTFIKEMFSIVAEKRLWLTILGEVDGFQIWLVRSRESIEHRDPKMLIVAGFHGEEKAGPYSILKWLKECDTDTFKKCDLSFIPIVNPIGFSKGIRYNTYGEQTNCGFCHSDLDSGPSREGKILIDKIELLRPLADDGFMSLHEDVTTKLYYLYTFEKEKEPGKFTFGMKEVLGQHFKKFVDGVKVETDCANRGNGPMVKDGIIYRLCDGSFEDWMFHLGVPRVVVTETPGMYKLKRRVNAGAAAIDKFIELNLLLREVENNKTKNGKGKGK
jgi:hypothetical protein